MLAIYGALECITRFSSVQDSISVYTYRVLRFQFYCCRCRRCNTHLFIFARSPLCGFGEVPIVRQTFVNILMSQRIISKALKQIYKTVRRARHQNEHRLFQKITIYAGKRVQKRDI